MRGETLKKVRLANLRLLRGKYTLKRIAELSGTNETYLSQIDQEVMSQNRVTPRSMSDAYAEKIEKGLGLPPGWMDQEHADLHLGGPVGSGKLSLGRNTLPAGRSQLASIEDRIRYALESRGMEYAPPTDTMEREERLYAIADAALYKARWLATGEGPKTQEEVTEDRIDLSGLSPKSKAAVKALIDSLADQGVNDAETG